ncbi:MAG: hypothetical protein IJZ03_07920 [Clostridia bacterium]|nr:hypothetical protein [Clostridia bacterium]
MFAVLSLLFIIMTLSGCHSVGDKAASLSIIYGATTFLSLLLLIGCCLIVRRRKPWFILLFSCVLIVNVGYTLLSVSNSLGTALLANRISYLGSVFLPLSMLMIILDVTNTRCKRYLTVALFSLSIIIFLIAASPGILPIYYRKVSFKIVNGVSTLVKTYGPLHKLYLFYLIGYFVSMITVIVRASVQKTVYATSHAVILAIAVFVNIGVWLIEQLSSFNFEMLSISYIISEMFLLGVHLVMNENQRLREIASQKNESAHKKIPSEASPQEDSVSNEAKECFVRGLKTLTPTEKAIYGAYIIGTPTKQIMEDLNIKENTLKFHNKNLYGKLGVSSRKQLLEIYRSITSDNG